MLQRPPDRRTRHKQRKAEGRCCVTVEIDGKVVTWLARPDIRALPAGREFYSRRELGAAITELLRVSSRD